MLRDREGRKLWIQTERGEFDPLESYQQIDERRKSQSGPDWWVVAKEPDWAPPKQRMSLVAGGLGGHTKPNSHGDQQPYDELGRYAGPGEGAWSEKPEGEQQYPSDRLTLAQNDSVQENKRTQGKRGPLHEPGDWPSGVDQQGRILGKDGTPYKLDPQDMFPKKPEVRDANLDPRITEQYEKIDRVFEKHHVGVLITSANDSAHKPNSLHYKNRVIDIQGKGIDGKTMISIQDSLRKELGKDYDVLYEAYPNNPDRNHIHIEYDPKEKRRR
mgnify:CR=1 FL=1